ncbi:methyltransferase domain-containing protein [bacterium NHP-B]|nr:methyltransferase domain-containing protein [bacterium NHP-B]
MRMHAEKDFDGRLFCEAATHLLDRLQPLTLPFHIIGDLSPAHTPGAEAVARRHRPHSHIRRLSITDAADAHFDLLYSPLALHWEEDPLAYLTKAHQMLAPGGLLLLNFWGGHTLAKLRQCLAEADFTLHGVVYPRILPMIRLEEATRLMGQTPFRLTVADRDDFILHYDSFHSLTRHLKRMGEGNALQGRATHPPAKGFWPHVKTLYKQHHHDKTSSPTKQEITVEAELITLTGWKEGPGLPQPLKRGSATHSLEAAVSSPGSSPQSP